MDTCHIQLDMVNLLAVSDQVKTAFGKFVKCNILSSIITLRFQTVGNDMTWQTVCNLRYIADLTIDNKNVVCVKLLCKLAERMTDVVDILEEIKMILFDIQDDFKARIELQKAVGVFAGFCNKVVRVTYADVAVNGFKIPPTLMVGSESAASRI